MGRTDDLGIEGYRVVVERPAVEELRRALAAAGAVAVERAAGEAVRVESGRPAFPIDMDRDTIPLEAGIADRAISFDKGCYVGQEVIIRILHRGQGRIARRLVGLTLGTLDAAEPAPPSRGAAIFSGDDEVGRVTSAVRSPALDGIIALGYVRRELADAGGARGRSLVVRYEARAGDRHVAAVRAAFRRRRGIIRRMPLYTGVGDRGTTALFDGTTVPKDDARVAVYGDVDELNAVVGLARAAGLPDDLDEMVVAVQRDLFAIGARLADPRSRISARVTKARIADADVGRLEAWIDRVDGALPPLRSFILPGGGPAGAALHQARAVCRRAERRIVGLGVDTVEPALLRYVNRLSDLLFALARSVNHRSEVAEIEW